MTCQCGEVSELWDDAAKRYAAEHLEQVEVRANGWEVVYRCPVTGRLWLEDYPRSAEQGGGPMRLRQLAEA
jgi:immunity protein 27 of polymorphic toxin system